MNGRRSLRFSLVAGVAGLTAAALVITWVTAAVALRSYLMERADEQLAAAAVLVRQRAALLSGPTGAELRSAVSVTDYLIEFRRTDGHTVRLVGGTPLPGTPLLDRVRAGETGPQTVLGDYRVRVVPVGNGTVLVGLPLAPVRDTVTRLAWVAAVTAVVVLALLTVLARWLVIRRLRPLDEIAATAGAIAAGDLDRRAGAPDPGSAAARTEVGRLSVAVDGMLARIQVAMAVRERSEQRMRAFVADASHELRTPVTSISGYLQLVRTGVVDLSTRPDVLRRIEEEAARMGALVDELLYLARLESDPPARRDPVDLAGLIGDAAADARAVEPDRPVAVSVTGPVTVPGDEGVLRRVLANLLGNVRAHTPPGTAVLVSAVSSGGRVRVTVADEGPGMPAGQAGRAFERFWRADPSRAGTDGAGLGLAIVAEAVRAHGGATGIDTGGPGLTVWFEIPI
ncbi:HAMP domain-containing sensor histidine kinase [Actinoplanes sp. NPDC026670]|uniref:sensor histidine kinase n=1 Tax=Actinoplanes sp. NPDC026670 TaxID=3154700 RepID=UPI0033E3B730